MGEIYNKTSLTEFLGSFWSLIYRTEEFSAFYDVALTKLADYFTEAIRIGLSNIAEEFAVISKKRWHLFTIKASDIRFVPGITPETNHWIVPVPDNLDYTFFLTENPLEFHKNYLHGKHFEVKGGLVYFYVDPTTILKHDKVGDDDIYYGWAYNAEIWDQPTIDKWAKLLSLNAVDDKKLAYSIIGALHYLVGGPTKRNLVALVTGCCGLPVVISDEKVFRVTKEQTGPDTYNYTIITDKNIYEIKNIKDFLVDKDKVNEGVTLNSGDVFTKIVQIYTNRDKLRKMVAGYFEGYSSAEGLEIDHIVTNDKDLYKFIGQESLKIQTVGGENPGFSLRVGADYTGRIGKIQRAGDSEPQPYGMLLEKAVQFLDENPSIIGVAVYDQYKNNITNFIKILEAGEPSWSYIIFSYGDDYREELNVDELVLIDGEYKVSETISIPDTSCKAGDDLLIGGYTTTHTTRIIVDPSKIDAKYIPVSRNGSNKILSMSAKYLATGEYIPSSIINTATLKEGLYMLKLSSLSMHQSLSFSTSYPYKVILTQLGDNYLAVSFYVIQGSISVIVMYIYEASTLRFINQCWAPIYDATGDVEVVYCNNDVWFIWHAHNNGEDHHLVAKNAPLQTILSSPDIVFSWQNVRIEDDQNIGNIYFKAIAKDEKIYIIYEKQTSNGDSPLYDIKLAVLNPESNPVEVNVYTLESDLYSASNDHPDRYMIDISKRTDYDIVCGFVRFDSDDGSYSFHLFWINTSDPNNPTLMSSGLMGDYDIPDNTKFYLLGPRDGTYAQIIQIGGSTSNGIMVKYIMSPGLETYANYSVINLKEAADTSKPYKTWVNSYNLSDRFIGIPIYFPTTNPDKVFIYAVDASVVGDEFIPLVDCEGYLLDSVYTYKIGNYYYVLLKISNRYVLTKIDLLDSDIVYVNNLSYPAEITICYSRHNTSQDITLTSNNESLLSLSNDSFAESNVLIKFNENYRLNSKSFSSVKAFSSTVIGNQIIYGIGNLHNYCVARSITTPAYLALYNFQNNSCFLFRKSSRQTNKYKIAQLFYKDSILGAQFDGSSCEFFKFPIYTNNIPALQSYSGSMKYFSYDNMAVDKYGRVIRQYLSKSGGQYTLNTELLFTYDSLSAYKSKQITVNLNDNLANGGVYLLRSKYDEVKDRFVSIFVSSGDSSHKYQLLVSLVTLDNDNEIQVNYEVFEIADIGNSLSYAADYGNFALELIYDYVNGHTIAVILYKYLNSSTPYLRNSFIDIDTMTPLADAEPKGGGAAPFNFGFGPSCLIGGFNAIFLTVFSSLTIPLQHWGSLVSIIHREDNSIELERYTEYPYGDPSVPFGCYVDANVLYVISGYEFLDVARYDLNT